MVTDSLMGITELQKPKLSREKVLKYVSPYNPFIKVSEKDKEIPFHKGFTRKEVEKYRRCMDSRYTGTMDSLGFAGHGEYTYPHGVKYVGEFRDGQFHGEGNLLYPQGQKIEGIWYKGKLVQSITKIGDEQYRNEYLEFPRRVRNEEIGPDNEVVCTEEELAAPQNEIPSDCYDTMDGYFSADSKIVYSYTGAMKRIAPKHEQEVIEKSYRQEADNPLGYSPELYEHWTSGRKEEIKQILDDSRYVRRASTKELVAPVRDPSLYATNFLHVR